MKQMTRKTIETEEYMESDQYTVELPVVIDKSGSLKSF